MVWLPFVSLKPEPPDTIRYQLFYLFCYSYPIIYSLLATYNPLLHSKSLSDDDRKLFDQLNLPKWFAEYVGNVVYLFPRCHNVSYAYQLLLTC